MKSKSNILYFVVLIAGLLFFAAMSFIVLMVGLVDDNKLMGLVFSGLFAAGAITVIAHMRQFRSITLSNDGIAYGGRQYSWQRVVQAELEGRQRLKYLGTGSNLEGIALTFDDGQTLQLFNKMYTNAGALKDYITARLPATGPANEPEERVVTEAERAAAKIVVRAAKAWFITYLAVSLGLIALMATVNLEGNLLLVVKLLFVAIVIGGAVGGRLYISRLIRKQERKKENGGQ